MNTFKQLFEATTNKTAKEMAKQAMKIVKQVTHQSHEFYDDSNEEEEIATTGDRVNGYDFGPQLIYDGKSYIYYDETEHGVVNKTFKDEKSLWVFFTKQLKTSEE